MMTTTTNDMETSYDFIILINVFVLKNVLISHGRQSVFKAAARSGRARAVVVVLVVVAVVLGTNKQQKPV